jgi:glycosyltransferase involved in cell wall biosynthesis
MNIHFLISGDINLPIQSHVYHKRITEGLKEKGHQVTIHQLSDDFPFPSDTNILKCKQILESISTSEKIVIEGSIFGVIPDILKSIQNPIIALMHVTFSADQNLTAYQREMVLDLAKKAQNFALQFIGANTYATKALINDGVEAHKITTIIPGIEHFAQKKNYPERPSKLLSVSNYYRNNGHVNLVKALTALKGKRWELHCYGNLDADKGFVEELQVLIRRNGLQDKIWLHPPLVDNALSDVYLNADLFIHPLNFEAYSMELATALAHGIPVVASTEGSNSEIIPPKMGKFFKPNVIYVLQTIIDELLENTVLYKSIAAEASSYHKQAHSWEASIDQFEKVLKSLEK